MNKTPYTLVLLVVALAVVASGCSSLNFDAEWDREVDFSQYRSYTWLPQEEGVAATQQLPQHLDIRLRRVVDDIMLDEKGFEKAVAPPEADLLFAYYIDTEKGLKVDYTVYGSYYGGYSYGYWPGYSPGYGGGGGVSRVREYTTGTLVLDVVDRRTKTLVWTGVIEGEAKYQNPSGTRVQQVMEKMMKAFPPM